MNVQQSTHTTPIWVTKGREAKFPQLNQKLHVDTVIIGAGITGITTALELVKRGQQVVILEALSVGEGTTGHSTGNLYVPIQPLYSNLSIKKNNKALIAQARAATINYIEENVQTYNLECHFTRRPLYLYANNNLDRLENEFQELKNAGLPIQYIAEMDLPVPFAKAVLLENQARFNPYLYVLGLAEYLVRNGCSIFEKAPVTSFEEIPHGYRVYTPEGVVEAKQLVMATHMPKGIDLTQMTEAPYRSYVVAATLIHEDYPKGQYWDLDNPHFITSTHALDGKKLNSLMIAGNHHKTGQGMKNYYLDIIRYLEQHYDVQSIERKWSAQHYQTADSMPYIGRNAKNYYIATGFFADGLTYGSLAGRLLSEIIFNQKNALSDLLTPTRHKFSAAPRIVKENVNVLCQYMKDFPGASTVKNVDELQVDTGGILESKGEKFGVYKDGQGKLHIVSAVCTHMKCIVNWNKEEKTWDCPCHGSRFGVDGEVIEGPALQNLEKFNSLKE
jgi:glycine/D-amino acid oxidase-like deaminating enzyme/nitrite reductase/ring-hydroxylating ferredoxin subunit